MRGSDPGELVFSYCEVRNKTPLSVTTGGAPVLISGLDYDAPCSPPAARTFSPASMSSALRAQRKQFGRPIARSSSSMRKVATDCALIGARYVYSVARACDMGKTRARRGRAILYSY